MPKNSNPAVEGSHTSKTSWIARHRLTVGWWLVSLGFLLVAFPPAYKQWSSGIPVFSFPLSPIFPRAPLSNPTGELAVVEQGRLGEEPIRIDPGLLSLLEPSQPPSRIVVPSRGIDLSVVEAKVVGGYWELSERTASHGVGSANPGEKGNTVIFAHARAGLFLPLREVKTGEAIYILTKDRWFSYKVAETKLVDPKDVEVIKPTDDETLTLFTCSGFMDTKRLIVVAKPLTL